MKELFAILQFAFPLMIGFWVIKFFNNPENAEFINETRNWFL
jgi:hypothetical protein